MRKGEVAMNHKIKLLLEILTQQDDYLTAEQLAETLGVTERSIRNYVKKINSEQNDNKLIVSSKRGYRLKKEIYQAEFRTLTVIEQGEDLLFKIALILISQDDYISFEELAGKVYYSPENIRSKVQLLFKKIDDLNIKVTLDSRIFTGIKIIGEENQKRLLLEQLVPLTNIQKESLAPSICKIMSNIVNEEDVQKEIDILDQVLSKFHATMDFIVYVKLIIHLMIVGLRNTHGSKLTLRDSSVFYQYPEYKIAGDVLDAQVFEVSLLRERQALTSYMISLPLNIPIDYTPELEERQAKTIEGKLKEAEYFYSIPLFSNKNYRTQVMKHITRLLNPLEESIPIFNPYMIETKQEYLFAYSIACFLYEGLQNEFEIGIPDSEIAYLAIHIQLFLTLESKNTIKTLLVFEGKETEAELYKYKIQNFFPTIEIENISTEYRKNDSQKYALILVHGYDEKIKKRPYIISVSHSFNKDDICRIQSFVDSIGTSTLLKTMDYYHISQNTPENAIKLLLNRSGYENLIQAFLKRELMSSTDIGNLAALPHPFLKSSETSPKIIVGIHDREIVWGNQKVKLIIIYIPTINLKTNKSLFYEVYRHTSNLKIVYSLIKSKTKEEFIEIWNSKGRI